MDTQTEFPKFDAVVWASQVYYCQNLPLRINYVADTFRKSLILMEREKRG